MALYPRAIDKIGLPFHGLHWNTRNPNLGTPGIMLPNGVFHHADQIDGSRSRLMKNPKAQALETTAAEGAKGWSWPDYLLVTGRNMCVGNVPMGEGHWLYVDPAANVWHLSYEPTPDPVVNNRISIEIKLHGVFGRFDPCNPWPSVEKTIGSFTFDIVTGTGINGTGLYDDLVDNTTTFQHGLSRMLEFNTKGDDVYINFKHPEYWHFYSRNGANLGLDSGVGYAPVGHVRFSVLGSGAMVRDDTLGDGISVSVTEVAQYGFQDATEPDYAGPPDADFGGQTWWGYRLPLQAGQTIAVEHHFIHHRYFDEHDNPQEARIVMTYLQEGTTDAYWTYELQIDQVTVVSHSIHAYDYTPPHEDIFNNVYEGFGCFDMCGDSGCFGLCIKDAWTAGDQQRWDGYMDFKHYLVTPDGSQGFVDFEIVGGLLATIYSSADRAAWHPVNKTLTYVPNDKWDDLLGSFNPDDSPVYI